jgi:hypothetical protein
MEITSNNPFAYFESLILSNGLETLLQKFLVDFVEHSDYGVVTFEWTN